MKSKAASVLADAIEAAATSAPTREPPPLPPPEQPPPELRGQALDLWIIDAELRETRVEMHEIRHRMRVGQGTAHGLAALGKRLDALMDRRRELRPHEPPDPHTEERRWKAASDSAVKKIRDGVTEARERMAALMGRPFPGDADVVSCGGAARAS
jgi:hypothetical protein